MKRHVDLKRAGTASWKGLCPFHAEKTPSFHVHESRQFFHCFGCGEKGDVLTFVEKIEQVSFMDALRSLARDAGVDLPERTLSPAERQAQQEAESEREQMFRVVEAAVAFFEEQLQSPAGAAARAYIEGRGITDAVGKRFRLGYAPSGWGVLERHLASKNLPLSVAESVGLLGVNDRGRYDFFRDRIMLPVLDRQKRPVGFSSRLLDPEAKDRKYVNSPDSPLFHKKELLYGLAAAADPIRKSREAIVVEGNFDVLSLHVAGFENTVAPMGTALTTEQITMLGRMADRVVTVFDGDEAGERAARKSVPIFVDADVDGRVARLPKKQDPDDFVRREGAAAFTKLLQTARPVVDHFIDEIARSAEATVPGRMAALTEAAAVFARVRNRTARELYRSRLAKALGVTEQQALRAEREVAGGTGRSPSQPTQSNSANAGQANAHQGGRVGTEGIGAAAGRPSKRQPPRDELEALVVIVVHPALARQPEARRVEELLTDPGLRPLCRAAIEALQLPDSTLDIANWLDAGPEEVREAVSSAVMDGRFDQVFDAAGTLRSLVARLERGRLEREIEQNNLALQRARQSGDEDAAKAISIRQMELLRLVKTRGAATSPRGQ
ncbi:MAG TPA: DNA primase [Polyangia bacterium]